MRISKFVFTAAAVVAFGLSTLPSQAGSWKFTVVNKSSSPATSFKTKEDGEWSSNWISEKIMPGDTFDMDFGTDKGDCTVRTQIKFADGSYFDADVDYCKVKRLSIFENHVSLD